MHDPDGHVYAALAADLDMPESTAMLSSCCSTADSSSARSKGQLDSTVLMGNATLLVEVKVEAHRPEDLSCTYRCARIQSHTFSCWVPDYLLSERLDRQSKYDYDRCQRS